MVAFESILLRVKTLTGKPGVPTVLSGNIKQHLVLPVQIPNIGNVKQHLVRPVQIPNKHLHDYRG